MNREDTYRARMFRDEILLLENRMKADEAIRIQRQERVNHLKTQIAKLEEPKRVRLTKDFLDPPTGMGYPEGTILERSPHSGQYLVEGTKLGGECVACFSLIKDICEPIN